MPQIASGNVAGTRMKLNIGGVERQATSGARTVTAQDANRAAGDRDTLTFHVTVLDNPTLAATPAPFPAPPPVV